MNEEVAALLREYAELTQITGGDVFRVRNYEKAARSIRGWPHDVGQLDLKALRGIPGVGTAQRGWLTPDDVINTWPLDRLRVFLRKGR
jgi:DNA polymerase/3'-5' exonuclease PolX